MSTSEVDLRALVERVSDLKGYDNAVDVLVEIALFEPDEEYVAVRANDAGSKAIYTEHGGIERTFWARDWTISPAARESTVEALRARLSHLGMEEKHGPEI